MHPLTLKPKFRSAAGEFLAALLLIQPLLDVLSYFMQDLNATQLTTALRTVLLFAVSLYGFAAAEHKKPYFILYGAAVGFWLLHMLNAARLGYADPLADAAEYLKLVQFPLWTLSFITLLRARKDLDMQAALLLAADFAIILIIIALSYLTGSPAYTYDIPSRNFRMGLLGWFAIPNAQSAIVSMLVPGLLLFAYRTERLWAFCLAAGLGMGLLYFTGTRLAYFSGILISFGFLVLVLIAGGKQRLFCIPLAVALVLLIGFKGQSIMEKRQSVTADAYDAYQAQTDLIMGGDKDFVYTGGELPPDIEEKITRVYEEVYTQRSVSNAPLLGDLLERFGTRRVMEEYQYSTRASVLYNARAKKLKAMALIWREQDWLTKMVGFEYSRATINGTNYDPENDFPALPYYYGYVGTALYLCFTGYFLLLALWGCLRNLRRLPAFLTVELGAYSMMYCLGLGAAQFSGQVLRKPSVMVYMSLAAAEMYLAARRDRERKLFARYERRPEVTVKQL